MEGNKDEAIRCIEIAQSSISNGDKEKAIKFLKKSISLYPTDKAKDLLSIYSSNDNDSPNQSSPSSTNHGASSSSSTSTSSTKTSSSTEETTTKIKYTKEQVEAIKRIKSCKTHYEVLEIQKNANETDIKKAYRKLALLMHPDKNHAPGAEDAFKKVTHAFSTLSDSSKRSMYDMHGDDQQTQRSPFQRSGGGFGQPGFDDDEFSPEDIFNMFFGIPPSSRGGVRNRRNTARYQFYSDFTPRHQQHQHHHHQAQRRQGGGESSMFSVLMLLIPLLYLLLSFFGGGGGSGPTALYSLSPSSIYRFKHNINITPDIPAAYYVKDDFSSRLRSDSIDLNKLEEEIKTQWIGAMQNVCKKKFIYEQYKNSLYGMQYREEYIRYNRDGLFEHCDELLKSGLINK